MVRRPGRLVYSTETKVCIRCGHPVDACRCSDPSAEPVPERIVARLSIERSGRGGKTVTVVGGLPRNPELLDEVARDLKRSCGVGGSSRDDRVELQGDVRERVRPLLEARGWTVKG